MSLYRVGPLVLVAAVAVAGCALPPGEIDIYKVQVQESFVHTDLTSNTFVLRGRGFTLSDNFGRILDSFGEYNHVGPLRLLRNIEQLKEEALRSWMKLKGDGNEQSPTAQRLKEIRSELETLQEDIEKRISLVVIPEPPTMILSPKALREPYFDAAVEVLREMNLYLEHLQETASTAVRSRNQQYGSTSIAKHFDIIFEVAGQPLTVEDWTYAGGTEGPIQLRPDRFDTLFKTVPDSLQVMFKYVSELVPPTPTLMLRAEKPTELDVEQLRKFLKSLTEGALNLSHALRGNHSAVNSWITRTIANQKGALADPKLDLKPISYEVALDKIQLDIQKARITIQRILDRLDRPIELVCSTFTEEKVRLEGYTREFSNLTHRDYNRPLRRAEKPGEPPVYLTIILKTLYLKRLGDATRNTPLLVTCALKTAANAEEAVYPIIFEKEFRPGMTVNRKDRIAYGPYPYKGEFLDFRLTVLELNEVQNEALINGFAKMSATAGAFNPQLAVLSPIVTALFGTLIHTINRDLVELDASFTLPGQKRDDKPNEAILIAETGHYIVMKREDPTRRTTNAGTGDSRSRSETGQSTVTDAETQKMLYRRLIFNPEDNKLYWRRYFNNPRDNFIPENEFTDQSYAVFSVTDQFPAQDELGAILRKQVAQAIGEERAKQIIPDLSHAAELLKSYKDIRKEERQIKALTNEKERAEREADLKKKKDDLWKDIPALQQQMITDVLYDTADPSTKAAFGTDPEKWKRADIVIGLDGAIQRRVGPSILSTLNVLPNGEPIPAFQERDSKLNWTFSMVKPENPNPDGNGKLDEKGMYKPPTQPTGLSVRVRAVGTGGTVPVTLERTIQVQGTQVLTATLESGGKTVQEGLPGKAVLHEFMFDQEKQTITVKMESKEPEKSPSNKPYAWKVAGSALPVELAKVPDGITNLKVADDTKSVTFDLEAGKLDRATDGFTLLAVPAVFSKLRDPGMDGNIPSISIGVMLRNPLSFEPGKLVIHWKKENAPVVDDLSVVLDKGVRRKLKTPEFKFHVVVDGAAKDPELKVKDAEPLRLRADQFQRTSDEGTVIITSEVELEGGKKLSLRRAIPYRIEK